MGTLATYKRDYSKAKTAKGKKSIMNKAMLNLSKVDQDSFISWQVKYMNN